MAEDDKNTVDDLLLLFVWLAKRQGVTEEELSKNFGNSPLTSELTDFWNKACKISNDNRNKNGSKLHTVR